MLVNQALHGHTVKNFEKIAKNVQTSNCDIILMIKDKLNKIKQKNQILVPIQYCCANRS